MSACEEALEAEGGQGREDGGTALPAQFGIGAATPPIVTPAIIVTPQPAPADAGELDASEDAGEADASLPAGDCGDGELSGDEVCDPGVQPCCNARCDGPANGNTVCRADEGRCDVQERCDGETFECPDDEVEDQGVVCRVAADLCDRTEVCTGEDPECPDEDRLDELEPCNGGLGRCLSDVCCPGATVSLGDGTCGSALDARLAFVTALDHDGAMGGLAGADARCNEAAADANLNGTYHAWLSAPDVAGSISATERVTYDALARVDGALISNSLDELLSIAPLVPIERTAWNEVRDVNVWTATSGRGGVSGSACTSWTNNDGVDDAGLIGDSGDTANWTSVGSLACDQPAALYCFQDDCPGTGHVDFTTNNEHCGECGNACAPELTCLAGQCAARVFVSSTTLPGSMDATGIGVLPSADAHCNERAERSMLSGTYRAWLSTTAVNASSRIIDAPYYRTDGVQVATGRSQLLSSLATPLMAPIDRTEDPTVQVAADTAVWTGTSPDGTLTVGLNCEDWTGTMRIQQATYGLAGSTDGTWTASGTGGCSGSASLYCFQISRAPLRGLDAVPVDR